VRAHQTAGILAAGLPGKASVKVLDALSPGHAPSSVLAQLSRVARRRRIALVGHEPGLGELAAHLIGAGRALEFKKGGVCRIDVESLSSRRAGALNWFVTPKVLRGLSKK
jgi:phosphohistidine phosphatase